MSETLSVPTNTHGTRCLCVSVTVTHRPHLLLQSPSQLGEGWTGLLKEDLDGMGIMDSHQKHQVNLGAVAPGIASPPYARALGLGAWIGLRGPGRPRGHVGLGGGQIPTPKSWLKDIIKLKIYT